MRFRKLAKNILSVLRFRELIKNILSKCYEILEVYWGHSCHFYNCTSRDTREGAKGVIDFREERGL